MKASLSCLPLPRKGRHEFQRTTKDFAVAPLHEEAWATTDAKDLLFRLLERKDEGALPDTYHENRVVRATDGPVVPCELLLESGPFFHGLGRRFW